MSVPKTVTKVTKGENGSTVTYTSDVDAAQYYIWELTRAALRDVAKYVKAVFKERYYSHFKERKKYSGKITSSRVLSSKSTKYPRVEIGLKTTSKPGFYAYFQEFGTADGKIPKLALLQHSVEDNVAEIVSIESQYLSELSGEAARLNSLISEDEYTDEGDADED